MFILPTRQRGNRISKTSFLAKEKKMCMQTKKQNDFLQTGAIASMLEHRLGQIVEYEHPRVAYAWRATYPVNESDPTAVAFGNGASLTPNKIIDAWNAASKRVSSRVGILYVDGSKAQRQEMMQRRYTSHVSHRKLHLHDHGRRVQMQIL